MKTYTQEMREHLVAIFTAAMEKRGIIPKNPWKCKKTELWIDSLGCKMHPCRQYGYAPPNLINYKNNVTFWVKCEKSKIKIRGQKTVPWMLIEAPHDVAIRILTLGHVS